MFLGSYIVSKFFTANASTFSCWLTRWPPTIVSSTSFPLRSLCKFKTSICTQWWTTNWNNLYLEHRDLREPSLLTAMVTSKKMKMVKRWGRLVSLSNSGKDLSFTKVQDYCTSSQECSTSASFSTLCHTPHSLCSFLAKLDKNYIEHIVINNL